MPATAVTNDFYRQALDLDLRGKREYTEMVLSAMGGIKRGYLSYLKNLLNLSDEAMELADRHDIEEKRLRYVTNLPREYHLEIVRQIIDFNLTSKQVKELCEGDRATENEPDPMQRLPAPVLRAAKVTQSVNTMSPQDLARALVEQEGDVSLARARIQAMQKLLSHTERLLKEG